MSDADREEWTLEEINDHICEGRDPRQEGGEDARKGKPLPTERLPEFLRTVHIRAQDLVHEADERAQEQFAAQAARLKENPFVLDSVARRVSGIVQHVATTIDQRLTEYAPDFRALGMAAGQSDKDYEKNLQSFDVQHPPGGWAELITFEAILIGIGLIELAGSAAWLRHALGIARAFTLGGGLALVSVGGGAFCAFVLLRYPLHRRTPTRRFAQTAWALIIVAGAVGIFYVGAAMRLVLIGGQEPDRTNMPKMLGHPVDVLTSNFDVLLLLVAGIVAFALAAIDVWHFYHGCRPILRRSGLAKEADEARLAAFVVRTKALVSGIGENGKSGLRETGARSAEWLLSSVGYCDEADRAAAKANFHRESTRRAVRLDHARYIDGRHEVVALDRVVNIPEPDLGPDLELPEQFVRLRESAVALGAGASELVQRGEAEIAKIVKAASIRIDTLAGYEAAHQVGTALLPRRDQP